MNNDDRGSFLNPVWTVGDYPSGCCGLLLLPFILPFILLAVAIKAISEARSRRERTTGPTTLDDNPVAFARPTTGQGGQQASVTAYVVCSVVALLLIAGILHAILT